MSEKTLELIKPIAIKNLDNDKAKIDIFLDYFISCDKKPYIFPGEIKKLLDIPIELVYFILNDLENIEFVEHVFYLVCPNCNSETGEIYKSISSIPDFCSCPHCGVKKINPFENAYVIYQLKGK